MPSCLFLLESCLEVHVIRLGEQHHVSRSLGTTVWNPEVAIGSRRPRRTRLSADLNSPISEGARVSSSTLEGEPTVVQVTVNTVAKPPSRIHTSACIASIYEGFTWLFGFHASCIRALGDRIKWTDGVMRNQVHGRRRTFPLT